MSDLFSVKRNLEQLAGSACCVVLPDFVDNPLRVNPKLFIRVLRVYHLLAVVSRYS